jgi:hypothetical protein
LPAEPYLILYGTSSPATVIKPSLLVSSDRAEEIWFRDGAERSALGARPDQSVSSMASRSSSRAPAESGWSRWPEAMTNRWCAGSEPTLFVPARRTGRRGCPRYDEPGEHQRENETAAASRHRGSAGAPPAELRRRRQRRFIRRPTPSPPAKSASPAEKSSTERLSFYPMVLADNALYRLRSAQGVIGLADKHQPGRSRPPTPKPSPPATGPTERSRESWPPGWRPTPPHPRPGTAGPQRSCTDRSRCSLTSSPCPPQKTTPPSPPPPPIQPMHTTARARPARRHEPRSHTGSRRPRPPHDQRDRRNRSPTYRAIFRVAACSGRSTRRGRPSRTRRVVPCSRTCTSSTAGRSFLGAGGFAVPHPQFRSAGGVFFDHIRHLRGQVRVRAS